MLEKLKEIICNYVLTDAEEITSDSKLRLDLGMTSFDIINVAVEIESIFGVKISNQDLMKVKTVGDIIQYIEKA